MVTGALASPITMSGSASGFINSSVDTSAASAATPGKGGSEETPSTARLSAAVVVFWQNSRRVICN